jgi:sugar-phosphatase
VVIEDAPAVIAAGRAAGCRVIAVATTHAATDPVAADVILDKLAQLVILGSLGGLRITAR